MYCYIKLKSDKAWTARMVWGSDVRWLCSLSKNLPLFKDHDHRVGDRKLKSLKQLSLAYPKQRWPNM